MLKMGFQVLWIITILMGNSILYRLVFGKMQNSSKKAIQLKHQSYLSIPYFLNGTLLF